MKDEGDDDVGEMKKELNELNKVTNVGGKVLRLGRKYVSFYHEPGSNKGKGRSPNSSLSNSLTRSKKKYTVTPKTLMDQKGVRQSFNSNITGLKTSKQKAAAKDEEIMSDLCMSVQQGSVLDQAMKARVAHLNRKPTRHESNKKQALDMISNMNFSIHGSARDRRESPKKEKQRSPKKQLKRAFTMGHSVKR